MPKVVLNRRAPKRQHLNTPWESIMRRLAQWAFYLATVFAWLTWAPAAPGQGNPPPVNSDAGVIFVVNGSGGGIEVTQNLWRAMALSGNRFVTNTVYWSRYQRALEDSRDYEGHLLGAQELAGRIRAIRQQQPGRKIYVVGHSAGCRVTLEATKLLPPDSVDRIVLLGASASYCFDLGPALSVARDGLDNFYSPRDSVLWLGTRTIGLSDGTMHPAGGRVGFYPPPPDHPSYALYMAKLRQYQWNPGVEWTGHDGRHPGYHAPEHLAAYVLPLLRQSEWSSVALPAGTAQPVAPMAASLQSPRSGTVVRNANPAR
jgi:pimeloyl-ACP methyl ester carboxylesterase